MFRNDYPYSDFHELNLDYLIREYMKLKKEIVKIKADVTEIEEKIEKMEET